MLGSGIKVPSPRDRRRRPMASSAFANAADQPARAPALGGGQAAAIPAQPPRLDHTAPIQAGAVAHVKRVSDKKLVYILSGHSGDSVVVKIETPGGVEPLEEFAARERALHSLAQASLPNAPGKEPLNTTDKNQLLGLDENQVAGDVRDLKDNLAKVGTQGQALERAIVVKMPKVEVGSDLGSTVAAAAGGEALPVDSASVRMNPQSAIKAGPNADDDKQKRRIYEPVKLKPGSHSAQSQVQLLMTSPTIFAALGRMATYDLLVSNQDRFRHDGSVNLENIDFTKAMFPNMPEVLPLDNMDPWNPLGDQWNGATPLSGMQEMTAYANKVVGYLLRKSRVELNGKEVGRLQDSFLGGMLHAAYDLKRREPGLRAQAAAPGASAGQQRVANVLAGRLALVNPN